MSGIVSDTGTNHFRVFFDTNVLISAVVWQNSVARKCLNFVLDYHRVVICEESINEVFDVMKEQFPESLAAWDRLLTQTDFELVYTPKHIDFPLPPIRDKEDKSILASAILAEPDIMISGDKDFHTQEIREYFAVYTPADFLRDFDNRHL